MNKNLKYYMGLNYATEIVKLDESDGGCYHATIPLLGRYTFVGDGETPQEALDSLNSIKKYLFKLYLEKGRTIPEPPKEKEHTYSGRLLLRIPIDLHRELTEEAQKNNSTLNQYLVRLLAEKNLLKSIHVTLQEIKEDLTRYSFKLNAVQPHVRDKKHVAPDNENPKYLGAA